MQYVVCLAKSHRIETADKNGELVYTRHISAQYINCTDAQEARIIADRIGGYQHETTAIPGVKVWNGKAFTFISFDDVEHVYDEMTNDRTAKLAAE